jgi:hypothetical protein
MTREEINKYEVFSLCQSNLDDLNKWFKETRLSDNATMMSITEKAKTNTLRSIIHHYKLPIDPNRELTRNAMIGIVRKEINRQNK